ncbi:MAG: protein kinase, partial [archaeon]|nr:protein kinase [archaeon]
CGFWCPGAIALVDVRSFDLSANAELIRRTSFVGVVLIDDNLYYSTSRLLARAARMAAECAQPLSSIAIWVPLTPEPHLAHIRIHSVCLAYLHFLAEPSDPCSPIAASSPLPMATRMERNTLRHFVVSSLLQLPAILPLPFPLMFLLQLLTSDFGDALATRSYFHPVEISTAVACLTVYQGLPVARLASTAPFPPQSSEPPPRHLLVLTAEWAALLQYSCSVFLAFGISQRLTLSAAVTELLAHPDAIFVLLSYVRLGKVHLHMHISASELALTDESINLGEGAGGVVRTAKLRGDLVAVKLYKPDLSETALKDIRNELSMLSILRHSNVIRCLGGSTEEGRAFMVMERADCDLAQWLGRQDRPLPEALVVSIAGQIASALCHIHSVQIIHRDLKSANCLVFFPPHNSLPVIKICDFGCGKEFGYQGDWTKGVGSFCWMSPEILRGDSNISDKSDIYAFALILYHCLTRTFPYSEFPQASVPHQVAKGIRPKINLSDFSSSLRTLLTRTWHQNPKKRPTAAVILGMLATTS